MIRVTAPSRLHFGLFTLPAADGSAGVWPDLDGQPTMPARMFGGVGLMIEKPGVSVVVEPAASWSAAGPLAARALAVAQRVAEALHLDRPHRVVVEGSPREHVGLGTGTQLSLAVARAVALSGGRGELGSADLARLAGRGLRSALGIHGFANGGFLVEGGKRAADGVAPLVASAMFPDEWCVLLAIPRALHGNHGPRESEAFASLGRAPSDLRRAEALCRLVLLGMLPALAERDLDAFGEALYDFNRRVGEMFRPWQGDIYAHPRSAALVRRLRSELRVRCVGQSSWGPAVFAVVDREHAASIESALTHTGWHADELIVTSAANHGAMLTHST